MGQRCCPIRSLPDFFCRVSIATVRIALHQQAAIALDDSEEIIEIVSDPGCELADRFHALGLLQSALHLFLFCDINQHAMEQPLAIGPAHQ